jgi:hypothetical protein
MDLEQYRASQAETARKFRSDMPGVANEQENTIKENSRRGLAADLSGVRGSFSQRGLLYSGLRRAAEADQGAESAAGAAAQRANVNQKLQGQAQSLDQNAISSGLELQRQRQQKADAEYDAEMAAYQGRQQALMGLGGSLGTVAGSLLGRK